MKATDRRAIVRVLEWFDKQPEPEGTAASVLKLKAEAEVCGRDPDPTFVMPVDPPP